MKMMNRFFLAACLALCLGYLNSCDDDDAPAALDLSTVTANDIDLNGATSPNNVPIDPTINISFTTDVDPATANNTNVTLTRDYDKANIPVTVTSSGAMVTVEPNEPLNPGALFTLSLGSGLSSSDGVAFTPVTRTFTTVGTFAPAGAIAYWTFEDEVNDVIDGYDPAANGIVNITYGPSHNAAAGKAAEFNGTNSIIEIPNGDKLMNTNDFTLSFWARPVSDGKTSGHFVLGLAAFYGFQMEIPANYSAIQLPVQFQYADGTTGTGGNLSFNGEGKKILAVGKELK